MPNKKIGPRTPSDRRHQPATHQPAKNIMGMPAATFVTSTKIATLINATTRPGVMGLCFFQYRTPWISGWRELTMMLPKTSPPPRRCIPWLWCFIWFMIRARAPAWGQTLFLVSQGLTPSLIAELEKKTRGCSAEVIKRRVELDLRLASQSPTLFTALL